MRTVHMQISIRGALKNCTDKELRGLFTNDDGTKPSASKVKDFLMDELAKGHTILPLCNSKDCPDFDRKGGGCPGHETEK